VAEIVVSPEPEMEEVTPEPPRELGLNAIGEPAPPPPTVTVFAVAVID
jgi:hypothetical protein